MGLLPYRRPSAYNHRSFSQGTTLGLLLFLMQSILVFWTLLLGLLPTANAITVWQRRNLTYPAPDTPATTLDFTNFYSKSDALSALKSALGNATISYPMELEYGSTVARVWTKQRRTYPDVVIYPETTEQVSILMQFYSNAHALWSDGFAIMGGGHADFGGAQSPSVIIDLQKLGATEIITNPPNHTLEYAILRVGGGAEAGDVYNALDGTGWAFLGPRAASIGVGGFLLGGGIAFQTNRYGVANDNLVGIEVVLVNGTVVYANPYNEYSDLFWATTGGGWFGFGIITNFYIQAYPDPGDVYVGTIAWGEDKADEVFKMTASWWENNKNPDAFPALLYYFKDPTDINALVPIKHRQFTLQLNALYFGGSQVQFNETFGPFLKNADSIQFETFSLRTLQQYLLVNYPYGYNRLFYGKSHTNSTPEFYQNTFAIYKETVNGMLSRGEDPGHTLWVDEYIFPGWNSAGPTSDADTAWPHLTSAHITLTSGEWSNSNTTEWMHTQDRDRMMSYLRDFQSSIEEPSIYDYPNYIAPYSKTREVWGEENFKRLLNIKSKYDPKCLFSRGRVPATEACMLKGLSNTSLD